MNESQIVSGSSPDEGSAVEPIVHILRHGFPLCQFTTHPPKDWPENHVWVGLDSGDTDKSNCKKCRNEARI